MAGSTYATNYDLLKEELKRYVEDDTTEFITDIGNIISRGQDRVARDLDLTIFHTSQSQPIVSGVATLTKPSGALAVRYYFFMASKKFAERRTVDLVKAFGGSGLPEYFAELDESTVLLAPTPDAAYAAEVSFVRRPPALAADAQTNWITDNAADLLLLACLIESEQYLVGDERLPVFRQDYRDKLESTGDYLRELSRKEYMPSQMQPPQASDVA